MARKKIVEEVSLDTLIPQYAENKAMLDDYKKICDTENKQIKELMTDDSYEAGGYRATKSVTTRDSLNEDKIFNSLDDDLRAYFEENNIIKTKEYIDTDILEAIIYGLNNKKDIESKKLLTNLIELLDKCRDTKEVVTLRVTKVKEKK